MLKFEQEYKSITDADVRAVENLIGSKLPDNYKKFMLKCNGAGVPIEFEGNYKFPVNGNLYTFENFLPIKNGYGTDNKEGTIESYYNHKISIFHPQYLVIGHATEGVILMGIDKGNHGQIFLNEEGAEIYKIRNSFIELVESMEAHPWEY